MYSHSTLLIEELLFWSHLVVQAWNPSYSVAGEWQVSHNKNIFFVCVNVKVGVVAGCSLVKMSIPGLHEYLSSMTLLKKKVIFWYLNCIHNWELSLKISCWYFLRNICAHAKLQVFLQKSLPCSHWHSQAEKWPSIPDVAFLPKCLWRKVVYKVQRTCGTLAMPTGKNTGF